MAAVNLDRLFGGKRGAAASVLASMKKTYGAKDGAKVFEATVIRRQRKARRPRGKK